MTYIAFPFCKSATPVAQHWYQTGARTWGRLYPDTPDEHPLEVRRITLEHAKASGDMALALQAVHGLRPHEAVTSLLRAGYEVTPGVPFSSKQAWARIQSDISKATRGF